MEDVRSTQVLVQRILVEILFLIELLIEILMLMAVEIEWIILVIIIMIVTHLLDVTNVILVVEIGREVITEID